MNFPQKLLIFSVLLFVTAANAQNSNPACALKKAQAEMLSSLKNVDNGLLYELDYQYDYNLDRLIENDVTSVSSFVKYAATKMMNPFKAVFHIKSLLPACSAFQAVTSDGDIIYARNFDFTFSEPSASVLVRTQPENGYASISMAPFSLVGKYVTNAYLNEGWQQIGHGFDRYGKVKDFFEAKNGVFTEEEAMQLLKDVSQTATAEKTSNTQWSAVYNLTKKTVRICMARDYDKVLEFEIIKRQY